MIDGGKARLDEAMTLLRSRKLEEATAAFEALVADRPDFDMAHYGLGQALLRQHKAAAEPALRRAITLNPSNFKAHFALGQLMDLLKRVEESASAYEAALNIQPDHALTLTRYARQLSRLSRHDEAERALRRAAEIDPSGPTLSALATLLHASRRPEAELIALKADNLAPTAATASLLARIAIDSERLQDAKTHFEQALQRDPDFEPARMGLAALAKVSSGKIIRTRPAIWPSKASRFDDFEKLVRDFVLTGLKPETPVVRSDSRVSALGSCFAGHIAQRLRDRDIDVFYKQIGEDVNNTYANRYLVDWIADGPSAEHGAEYESIYGPQERADFRERFASTDIFIFTLGVAPAYFHRETGEFVLPHGGDIEAKLLPQVCNFRTTTVAENVANLRHILNRLKVMSPNAKFVLTLSPVPLMGTYEMPSAVIADALSKSTLRVAVDTVLGLSGPDTYYWPSFEIIRWLGAHAPKELPPMFGAEDGYSRHVSVWLVDMIMRLFLEYFGEPAAPRPAVSAAPQLAPLAV